ncbi:MAG TPA: hypothetical protein VKZ59_10910 [Acidobacteriota bacterium]|nr:hypothetical protein [Acidobacteriota bacterium]
MRSFLQCLSVFLIALLSTSAIAAEIESNNAPLLQVSGGSHPPEAVTVAYFYKVKWGYQEEFLNLYRKNHYPILKAQVDSGRLLEVQAFTPRFHGDGHAAWTFMAVLVFKNWEVMADSSEEQRLIQELFPDQEAFRREEQRRFELLEAHWDVPLRVTPME